MVPGTIYSGHTPIIIDLYRDPHPAGHDQPIYQSPPAQWSTSYSNKLDHGGQINITIIQKYHENHTLPWSAAAAADRKDHRVITSGEDLRVSICRLVTRKYSTGQDKVHLITMKYSMVQDKVHLIYIRIQGNTV